MEESGMMKFEIKEVVVCLLKVMGTDCSIKGGSKERLESKAGEERGREGGEEACYGDV